MASRHVGVGFPPVATARESPHPPPTARRREAVARLRAWRPDGAAALEPRFRAEARRPFVAVARRVVRIGWGDFAAERARLPARPLGRRRARALFLPPRPYACCARRRGEFGGAHARAPWRTVAWSLPPALRITAIDIETELNGGGEAGGGGEGEGGGDGDGEGEEDGGGDEG